MIGPVQVLEPEDEVPARRSVPRGALPAPGSTPCGVGVPRDGRAPLARRVDQAGHLGPATPGHGVSRGLSPTTSPPWPRASRSSASEQRTEPGRPFRTTPRTGRRQAGATDPRRARPESSRSGWSCRYPARRPHQLATAAPSPTGGPPGKAITLRLPAHEGGETRSGLRRCGLGDASPGRLRHRAGHRRHEPVAAARARFRNRGCRASSPRAVRISRMHRRGIVSLTARDVRPHGSQELGATDAKAGAPPGTGARRSSSVATGPRARPARGARSRDRGGTGKGQHHPQGSPGNSGAPALYGVHTEIERRMPAASRCNGAAIGCHASPGPSGHGGYCAHLNPEEGRMPRYMVVERTFPDGLQYPITDQGAAACLAVVRRNGDVGVTWASRSVRERRQAPGCSASTTGPTTRASARRRPSTGCPWTA